jgi:4-diphosphocytidyl-2-C-methyl-D-erythritol kinase
LPDCWALLVNPGTSLPTPRVYRARSGGFTAEMRFAEAPADAATLARLLADRRNDLEPAAITLVPQIEPVLQALTALPGCLISRMSGSGATCFGLFATSEDAVQGAAIVMEEHPGWWAAAGRLLDDTAALEPANHSMLSSDGSIF